MMYTLTALETHLDKGFGVTADSYYASAKHLETNKFENFRVTPQAELPQNFLFRHAIELYLKSLITIFHNQLHINYGSVPFDSHEPMMRSNGNWRKLYTCHHIDALYEYWSNELLEPNIQRLTDLAPMGTWEINNDITTLLKVVTKYDKDSSFFRYPITNNSHLDHKKNTMSRISDLAPDSIITEIQSKSSPENGTFTMLVIDDNDGKIVEAFIKSDNVLTDVRDALKEIAYYFYCLHVMVRMTICKGH